MEYDPEVQRRYNTSEKGRARTRRYRQSEHGRAVRRAQSERYYHDPAHALVLMGKQVRAAYKRREANAERHEKEAEAMGREIERLAERLFRRGA